MLRGINQKTTALSLIVGFHIVLLTSISCTGTLDVHGRVRSKWTRVQAEFEAMKSALKEYYTDHSDFPANLAGLTAPVPYLYGIPKDPFSADGVPLSYRRLEKGRGYRLYSVGPDQKDDGGVLVVGDVLNSL
jgi:hypothetical protein